MKTKKTPRPSNGRKETLEAIARDRMVRQTVARQSHLMFFHLYFPHYVKYPIADFQKEIFRITEDVANNLACIVAFRGSGKSTLVTFSYAIWSILGVQQKKFVLIICQTRAQARQHMMNLRRELEHNKLLRSDLGPFQEETGEWAMSSIVFSNTGARIMIASIDQSIRGVRHHEHRPDLIILDDIEDLNSTKTLEGRNGIFDWFTREVVPLGDMGTRIIAVGNLLHEDSLMMRLKKKIDEKELKGVFRWFPLINEEGTCLWPGKFDTQEKLDELCQGVANDLAWQQEYLLKIVSDSTRVIWPDWIQYYDGDAPKTDYAGYDITAVGIDLAISLKDTADYTAMVFARVVTVNDDTKIYILPNPVNERLTFPDTIDRVKAIYNGIGGDKIRKIYVENVGYQEAVIQQLARDGVNVEGINHHGQDKRARLALTTHHIKTGGILFPRRGAEELIAQLTGFGREHHDDLADAFAIVILKLEEYIHKPKVSIHILSRDYDDDIESSSFFRNPWRRIF